MKPGRVIIAILILVIAYEILLLLSCSSKQSSGRANAASESGVLKDGDLIFQTSLSPQSKAIQLATKSVYSHCGILYRENGSWYVFEAVQPVKLTPIDKWIARGDGGKYVVKRLKNREAVINAAVLDKMKRAGAEMLGKNYDLFFGWSDERIYCSELIWKVYQRGAGIEVGKLQQLSDFDLSNKLVQKKLKERYGNHIPKGEIVISPEAIFESNLLTTVLSD